MKTVGKAMGSARFYKFFIPVAVFALLLYLASLRLPESHRWDCRAIGGPCLRNHISGEPGGDVSSRPAEGAVESTEHSRLCRGRDFQIHRVLTAFNSAVTVEREILLDRYLEGWDELVKFLEALGTVIGFISQEVKGKLGLVRDLRRGAPATEKGDPYRTLRSMMAHELRAGLVDFRRQSLSGCRTLLRLHRSLHWLQLFLRAVERSSAEDSMGALCSVAYNQALAPYHSWLLRQAVGVALVALPDRAEFFRIVCGEEGEEEKGEREREGRQLLERTVLAITRVYNITQEAYQENGMLDLP
ncbi:ceramide-1-phosphate transfer protein-like isoform X1 [Acipenser ruthenus]|uniref:ceramide-1-phosphate transfer protein-like isoform X1 n=1 Tax=Acipenser ruthenus TaxID=7906 RepID=UPI00274136AE|nr:ceramide-1-phosphate transfer protein-like isoform X1 [Acipenser ruthenus]XP_058876303.1 ceramide-1-phosphate transfer protein-like isoform X1 [Acipenser ruthenus]